MALNVVGIVCALASEARHLGPIRLREPVAPRRAAGASRDSLRCPTSPRWGFVGFRPLRFGHAPVESLPDGTLVAVTGMGSSAASKGAAALIEAGATALASFGMAGGLDPTLSAGAILLPTEVIGMDGKRVATAQGWRDRVTAAVTAHGSVRSGSLVSTTRAIGSVADKAELFRATGAAAVDMESLAVGETAQSHQLPFIVVRVIVDSAGDALPNAVTTAADKEGHLHIWRLIGALALAPNELAPLLRLARRYRAANRSLAAVARTGSLRSLAPSLAPAAIDSRVS